MFVVVVMCCIALLVAGARDLGAITVSVIGTIAVALAVGSLLLPDWWPGFVLILVMIDIGLVLAIFGEDLVIR